MSHLQELLGAVRNFLEFEEEQEIGPDCQDPDSHERLSRELLELCDEIEAGDRVSADSNKALTILEKAMRKGAA